MRTIVISETAQKQLISIFSYLDENWSLKIRIKFTEKVFKNFKIIENNPELFPILIQN